MTVFQEELEEWCEEYDNEFSDLDELHTLLSGLDSLSYYVGMVKKRYRTSSEQQNRVLFFREKSAVFKIFLKMAVFFELWNRCASMIIATTVTVTVVTMIETQEILRVSDQ